MTNAFRILVALSCAAGCTTGFAARSSARRSVAAEQLAADLGARGLRVVYANPIEHAFFAVGGSVYTIEGEDLQVFVYPTESAAAGDASRIASSGGTVGTAAIGWIAPPHIFRKRSMIVIYLGSNARTRGELSAELGNQIAGAD